MWPITSSMSFPTILPLTQSFSFFSFLSFLFHLPFLIFIFILYCNFFFFKHQIRNNYQAISSLYRVKILFKILIPNEIPHIHKLSEMVQPGTGLVLMNNLLARTLFSDHRIFCHSAEFTQTNFYLTWEKKIRVKNNIVCREIWTHCDESLLSNRKIHNNTTNQTRKYVKIHNKTSNKWQDINWSSKSVSMAFHK